MSLHSRKPAWAKGHDNNKRRVIFRVAGTGGAIACHFSIDVPLQWCALENQ